MKRYVANATCDWGTIYYDVPIEASSFGTAIARAGKKAYKEARRRPKQINVQVRFVGSIKKDEHEE